MVCLKSVGELNIFEKSGPIVYYLAVSFSYVIRLLQKEKMRKPPVEDINGNSAGYRVIIRWNSRGVRQNLREKREFPVESVNFLSFFWMRSNRNFIWQYF